MIQVAIRARNGINLIPGRLYLEDCLAMKTLKFRIFCCCSDVVSAMDMSGEIAIELDKLENEGIEAFDAHLKEMVIVVAPLLCIVADNPQASELLNHLGGSAHRYCRMCMVSKLI